MALLTPQKLIGLCLAHENLAGVGLAWPSRAGQTGLLPLDLNCLFYYPPFPLSCPVRVALMHFCMHFWRHVFSTQHCFARDAKLPSHLTDLNTVLAIRQYGPLTTLVNTLHLVPNGHLRAVSNWGELEAQQTHQGPAQSPRGGKGTAAAAAKGAAAPKRHLEPRRRQVQVAGRPTKQLAVISSAKAALRPNRPALCRVQL